MSIEEFDRGEVAHRLGHALLGEHLEKTGLIPGVCDTCTHAVVTERRGAEHATVNVFCRQMKRFVPPDIARCSAHWRRGQMSLHDMGEMATLLDPRDPGGQYA